MDPDATLNELLDAVYAADLDTAMDRLADLVYWIDADGFPPRDPRKELERAREVIAIYAALGHHTAKQYVKDEMEGG